PGQCVQRHAEGEVVAPRAAALLRERQPEQPHLAHLPDDLVRERVLLVVLADDGCHGLAGELAHGLPQGLVFLTQLHGVPSSPRPLASRRSAAVTLLVGPDDAAPLTLAPSNRG